MLTIRKIFRILWCVVKREGISVSSTADMLRQLRESTGLNQKDFAASVGMKQTTYNGYETGKHRPKSDVLIAIADKYNVSVDYLLGISCDDSDITKKSPSTTEVAPGDDVFEIFSVLNSGLISLGLLSEDEDITEQQAEILISVSRILHATFDKS